MKKLTVRLDDDLSLRLRHLALDRHESLQRWVERLLREEVAKIDAPKTTRKRRGR